MKIKRFVSNHFNIIFLLLFIGLAALLTKDFFTTTEYFKTLYSR